MAKMEPEEELVDVNELLQEIRDQEGRLLRSTGTPNTKQQLIDNIYPILVKIGRALVDHDEVLEDVVTGEMPDASVVYEDVAGPVMGALKLADEITEALLSGAELDLVTLRTKASLYQEASTQAKAVMLEAAVVDGETLEQAEGMAEEDEDGAEAEDAP